MGCSSSAPQFHLPPANVPTATKQNVPSHESPAPAGIQPGSLVLLGSAQYAVQYVTSKGTLDLKSSATGDVLYGIAREEVIAVNPEGCLLYTSPSPRDRG